MQSIAPKITTMKSSAQALMTPTHRLRYKRSFADIPVQNNSAKSSGGKDIIGSNHKNTEGSRELSNNHHNWRNRHLERRRQRDHFFNNFGMSPFGRDPFNDLQRSFFGDLFGSPSGYAPASRALADSEVFDFNPHVDMHALPDRYEITAELPGISKENIKIEVTDDVVTIRGEKKSEISRGKEGTESYYTERSFGTFVRRFSIPEGADAHKVKAEFKDGVLKLDVPKKQASQTHHVEIN